MTSRQFVDLIEQKFAKHDVTKVIPEDAKLARHWRHLLAQRLAAKEFDKLRGEIEKQAAEAALPEDLAQRVADVLKTNPEYRGIMPCRRLSERERRIAYRSTDLWRSAASTAQKQPSIAEFVRCCPCHVGDATFRPRQTEAAGPPEDVGGSAVDVDSSRGRRRGERRSAGGRARRTAAVASASPCDKRPRREGRTAGVTLNRPTPGIQPKEDQSRPRGHQGDTQRPTSLSRAV